MKSELAKILDDFVDGQELPYSETKVMSEKLAETVSDTLAWHKTQSAEQQSELKIGIKPEREKMVLEAWNKHING